MHESHGHAGGTKKPLDSVREPRGIRPGGGPGPLTPPTARARAAPQGVASFSGSRPRSARRRACGSGAPPPPSSTISGISHQDVVVCYRVPTSPKSLHFPCPIGIAPREIRIPIAMGGLFSDGPTCCSPITTWLASESRRAPVLLVLVPGFSLFYQGC